MKLPEPIKIPRQNVSQLDAREVRHFTLLPEDRKYGPEEWEQMRLCTDESGNIAYRDVGGGCTYSAIPKLLDLAMKNYVNDNDGYALIAAYLRCYEEGLLPPPWVLKGLYDRFSKWEGTNLNGDSRIFDEVFAAGTKTDWRERHYERVRSALFYRYSKLKYYWGIKDTEIFKILAISLEEEGIEDSNHIPPVFSSRMIAELHKNERWRDRHKGQSSANDKHRPFLQKDEADQWLQKFPEKAQRLIHKHQKRDPTQDYTKD